MHPLGLQISFILYQMFLIHQKFYAMWRIRIYDNFSFDFNFVIHQMIQHEQYCVLSLWTGRLINTKLKAMIS